MIASFALALAMVAEPEAHTAGCEPDAPLRDPEVCKPLYEEGEFVIYNMESVAVGTVTQMKLMRPRARECGLSNRIDYVGQLDLAVFDIVNANKETRDCILSWIAAEHPGLAYSKKRFDEAFDRAASQQVD